MRNVKAIYLVITFYKGEQPTEVSEFHSYASAVKFYRDRVREGRSAVYTSGIVEVVMEKITGAKLEVIKSWTRSD